MTRLVIFVLIGSVAACYAAPHKVDPQDERGSSRHSYNVAHIGHHGGGGDTGGNTGYSDDGDRDYPGGGTFPGGGGYNYPKAPQRSNRVRRHYEGEYGYGGHRYGRHGYSGHSPGPVAYHPHPLQTQAHSYSKASASSSSGSGGGHYVG